MSTSPWPLGRLDRARIETVVWRLDNRLSDLPARRRRAIRSETRANLHAAAVELGVAGAVRGLGDLRDLAAGYLDAEYSDGRPRPSYVAGLVALLVVQFAAGLAVAVGSVAFVDGLRAAHPGVTGTFSWDGIPFVSQPTVVTMHETGFAIVMAWTPWVYVVSVLALVIGGRLWRLRPQPQWFRRRGAVA